MHVTAAAGSPRYSNEFNRETLDERAPNGGQNRGRLLFDTEDNTRS